MFRYQYMTILAPDRNKEFDKNAWVVNRANELAADGWRVHTFFYNGAHLEREIEQ